MCMGGVSVRRLQIVFMAVIFAGAGVSAAQQQPPTKPTAPAQPSAQDVAALLQKITDLEDRVVALEGQLRQLKAQGAPPAAPTPAPEAAATPAPGAAPPPAPATAEQGRLGGAGAAAAKALNPDISMIGDFIASAGHN